MVEALRFLSAALRINSSSADAMSNLGLALHATGRHDERSQATAARCGWRRIIRKFSTISATPVLKPATSNEALSSYDGVLARDPGHVGALVNRGNTLLRLNQPAEAIASYDSALAAMPRHPQILTNRGHALRRLDRPAEALVDFKGCAGGRAGISGSPFRSGDDAADDGDFDRGLEGI